MPDVNWSTFETLPGAANHNFELLCQSVIRGHYGRYGRFRYLANQPGVEFHLRLEHDCALGAPPKWFGWQCRWYELPSGTNIGATRRHKIEEAIAKTEKNLPGITDWILWTRHVLTADDQRWFYAIQSKMRLALWTTREVEEHLSGPAAILRETYFGELVLTPDILNDLHTRFVQPIRPRWMPDVHQTVDAERDIHRSLGEVRAWSALVKLADEIAKDTHAFETSLSDAPERSQKSSQQLLTHARLVGSIMVQCYDALKEGQYEGLRQLVEGDCLPTNEERRLVSYFRTNRHQAALFGANVLADMHVGQRMMRSLKQAINHKLVFVTADAGCGKTQLSAQLSAATPHRSAGIFLRGKSLGAGKSLNSLARQVSIHGRDVPNLESLIAALDAAGQRQKTRLPLFIDGLNESEDPRDWKDELSSLAIILNNYEHVQVVCTLRTAFVHQALPDNAEYLEIAGFGDDLNLAVRRYFTFYKINAVDAELPWELLNHPLTLRMFCEVTNPRRSEVVGVGSIPGSLSVLFERYIEQASDRIAGLSPRTCRFFPADVTSALNQIGFRLWESHSRDIGIRELRHLLKDETRTWDQSLVAALENEGLLFREPGTQPDNGRMSVNFDALAGHVIAASIFGKHSGESFHVWLRDKKTQIALTTSAESVSWVDRSSSYLAKKLPKRYAPLISFAKSRLRRSPRYTYHPLAYDIFRSLVGLTPRRANGSQLWPLLSGEMRTAALVESAYLDSAHLDQDTVAQLIPLVRRGGFARRNLFNRLFGTRAAQAHPLNANFLDTVLRGMPVSDRDLRWSEWLRNDQSPGQRDVEYLVKRWSEGHFIEPDDILRARWIMWTLTSTMRKFRDQATCALYHFGCRYPGELYNLVLDSLSINDPYVPERGLAACYGVSMNLWADPRGTKVREALPKFAGQLVNALLVDDAPHATPHSLIRGYALGIAALALRLDPNCISEEKRRYLNPNYPDIRSTFPSGDISDEVLTRAKHAMRMDFENYTLGHLVPERSNYDFKHPEYLKVKRQIASRICELGYSEKFDLTDRMISNTGQYDARERQKVDRYGKKYSWIAYFEMYGLRFARGDLDEYRDARPSEVDIDPSFPVQPKKYQPTTGDLFSGSPTTPREWLSHGPTPDYEAILQSEVVDGIHGPWVLVQGFIEECAPEDDRQVFTFLRGIFSEASNSDEVLARFHAIDYPGNSAVPEPLSDYYTYAGEIPWSSNFATDLRDVGGNARRNIQKAFRVHDGKHWLPGVPIEVPAHDFGWESYHSKLNQVSGIIPTCIGSDS